MERAEWKAQELLNKIHITFLPHSDRSLRKNGEGYCAKGMFEGRLLEHRTISCMIAQLYIGERGHESN